MDHIQSTAQSTLPSEDPYPIYKFSPLTEKLTCPICLGLLNRPIQLLCKQVVCATCCCQAIELSYSLKCPCCYDHHLSSVNVSLPSTFLLSVLNEVVVTCVRKCGKEVKVQHYEQHHTGKCRSHYNDLNSPSKVTLQDVLNKPSTTPATSAEMKATHHLAVFPLVWLNQGGRPVCHLATVVFPRVPLWFFLDLALWFFLEFVLWFFPKHCGYAVVCSSG